MKFSKIMVYWISLSVSIAAIAADSYVGLQLGSHFFSEAQTITAQNVSGYIHRHQAIDGVEASVLYGRRVMKKQFYLLDAEVFAGYNADKNSSTNTLTGPPFMTSLSQKLTYSLGARLLPGYQIHPNASLFGLVGYIQTQLRSVSADGVTDGVSGHQSLNFNGLQLGLGANIDLKNNLKLRLQDSYAFYAGRALTTYSSGLAQLPITFKMSPYANVVSIGLVKQFL